MIDGRSTGRGPVRCPPVRRPARPSAPPPTDRRASRCPSRRGWTRRSSTRHLSSRPTAPSGPRTLIPPRSSPPPPSIPARSVARSSASCPYWELSDSSTRLDWEKISTVAYFGVGADGKGNLHQEEQRRLHDRRLERLDQRQDDRPSSTRPIASHARVVLTVQSFAWTVDRPRPPEEAARQRGGAGQPRAPDRLGRAGPRRRRRQPRLRADRLGLRGRVHRARAQGPVVAERPSRRATSSRSTRPAGSATTRSRRRPPRAAPTRS